MQQLIGDMQELEMDNSHFSEVIQNLKEQINDQFHQ